jgi:adenylate cyclase
MKIKLKKATPFLLSAVWIILALWIELAPRTLGFITDSLNHVFRRLDYLSYDTKIRSRIKLVPSAPHSIAIVAIDDASIQAEGRWPWPYSLFADLIIKLREQGVSVIASDILFNEAEPNMISLMEHKLVRVSNHNPALFYELNKLKPEFDDNAKLILQIQNKNDIVLPFLLYEHHIQGILPDPIASLDQYDLNKIGIPKMSGYITNFSSLQHASSHNGFISTRTDEDGVVRRTPLVLRYQDKIYPSLALATAQILFKTNDVTLNIVDIGGANFLDSVQLGKLRIPTDQAGRVMIPFQGKSHSFKYYSASDVLKNKVKPGELKNTIIFIGITAAGFAGFSNTSVDTDMPNVEVHANVLNGMITNDFPRLAYWSKAATIGLVLLIGLTLGVLLPLLIPTLAILLAMLTLVLLFFLNAWLWAEKSIVFSFSSPAMMTIMLALTNMTYRFIFESRKKIFLREAFGHYLAPEYVKILVDHPEEYSLEGESVELTVLFADIRNFTTITESLDAARIKTLLNKYFSPMTQIIFNHGGTIDKYVGDMIMAFWGAPIKNERHREAAIEAALDMLAKSEELKDDFLAAGFPNITIGIGLNTGVMNVGDMGSEFRRSYTVLGDPVNLGARLESSTKYYRVKLLVGSATRANVTGFVFRLIDRVKVKGKHQAVDVYEVICRIAEATPELLEEIKVHDEAINAYFLMNWALAQELFASLAKEHPDTYIYKLFLERINTYKQNPPPMGWDGSFERQDK